MKYLIVGLGNPGAEYEDTRHNIGFSVIDKIAEENNLKFENSKLGFVPTMGGLHKGHISLIKESQKKCNSTLVSIYVNPKQFNKKKDFLTYPNKLQKDLSICKKLKVDYQKI